MNNKLFIFIFILIVPKAHSQESILPCEIRVGVQIWDQVTSKHSLEWKQNQGWLPYNLSSDRTEMPDSIDIRIILSKDIFLQKSLGDYRIKIKLNLKMSLNSDCLVPVNPVLSEDYILKEGIFRDKGFNDLESKNGYSVLHNIFPIKYVFGKEIKKLDESYLLNQIILKVEMNPLNEGKNCFAEYVHPICIRTEPAKSTNDFLGLFCEGKYKDTKTNETLDISIHSLDHIFVYYQSPRHSKPILLIIEKYDKEKKLIEARFPKDAKENIYKIQLYPDQKKLISKNPDGSTQTFICEN